MSSPQPNHVERNKALARKFFDEAFNKGNLAVVDETIAATYTFNGAPQKPEDVKGWVTGLRAGFPDLHFVIDAILGEGNDVALRWRLTATYASGAKAGARVEASGTNIVTMNAEGKCVANMQNGKATLYIAGRDPIVHADDRIYSME